LKQRRAAEEALQRSCDSEELDIDEDSTDEGSEDSSEYEGSHNEEEEEENKAEDINAVEKKSSRTSHGSASPPVVSRKAQAAPPPQLRAISKKNLETARVLMGKGYDAVIVPTASFEPSKRRKRVEWSDGEIRALMAGVEKHGSSWSSILADAELRFHGSRTQVDLKDKYRNVTSYRDYGSLPLRRYTVLDKEHQIIMNPVTRKPFFFKNRWPREAALKVASRQLFYQNGATTTRIFLREVAADEMEEMEAGSTAGGRRFSRESLGPILPIVHVYEGTRQRQLAPDLPKFEGKRHMWVADVRKIREEQYVTPKNL